MTLREKAAAWDRYVARRKAYDMRPEQVLKRKAYEASDKRRNRKRTPEYKEKFKAYYKEWYKKRAQSKSQSFPPQARR